MPEAVRTQLDERPFIQAVLQAGRYRPFEVQVDQLSPWVKQERLLGCLDQVYFAPTLSIYWALYQAASQQGIRVYLEGIDGDLTVSHGLERLPELFLSGRWGKLAGEARALSANGYVPKPASKIIWQYGIRPIIPPHLVDLKRAIRGGRRPSELTFSLLQPEFAHRTDISEHTLDELEDGPHWRLGARQKHWLSLTSAHIPLALEMLDHLSAGLSLELRYPFFDRRLVEFCLALPAEQKLSQGITRRIQRMAMADMLPEDVVWRNWKADFLVYFQDALLRHEHARAEEVVYKTNRSIQPYVNLATLRSVWEKYKNDPMGSLQEAGMVYAAVQLAAWLEHTRL
jgi:asparagine synthase (glutamine-hydrolysing)